MKVARGTRVTELIAGTEPLAGVPHVVGVRTADGGEIRADVVIDAMGRKSELSGLIPAVGGGAPIEEAEDCGFVY